MLNLLHEKFIQSGETYDQNNLPVRRESCRNDAI